MTLTLAKIEERLERVCDELEEQLLGFRELAEASANAEADFKHKYARCILMETGEKESVAQRDARAMVACEREHRAYKVYEARVVAGRESLRSLHALSDVMRTQAANLRAVPGV